eukprot:CAMPEP_0179086940 /NCGR_PEP_ID=MMETSP0796-20121207/39472_1 /TAXON_ID=73915 /ORGANISM="Pyrodinium bahamense, Strain pbaha01" /LENGTH=43 /DNA_ID= /DNA_START= /DNA_END= /DNA_ORIENTATION=
MQLLPHLNADGMVEWACFKQSSTESFGSSSPPGCAVPAIGRPD